MTSRGTVRDWLDDEGWGVVDTPRTPGGCWVHSSAVAVAGYRSLRPGQRVVVEHEPVAHDGFDHRAVRVRPDGGDLVDDAAGGADDGTAYTSTLTVTFDDGSAPRGRSPQPD